MRDETAGSMEPPARFRGLPVSAGTAAGMLRIIGDTAVGDTAAGTTPEDVTAAFAAVAAERSALAERLRAAGRGSEADIIAIGALIAGDPSLSAPAIAAMHDGTDAATAVRAATEGHAAAMEKLDNPELADRAGDIRQIASAVLERLRTGCRAAGPDSDAGTGAGDFILVRREVSPADLIELAEAGLVGAVSVAGGASSHAAIVARGLGVPMIAGASPEVLALSPGLTAVLDADSGELVVGGEGAGGGGGQGGEGSGQGEEEVADAQRAVGVRRRPGPREVADDKRPAEPPRTADGHQVVVLCNVASAVETRRGLAAGAAGVGLLRTELPFTQAPDWPTLAQQRSQLGPILELLADRTAIVRLLDFSGDKIPPFLGVQTGGEAGRDESREAGGEAGRDESRKVRPEASLPAGAGLAALLAHPFALAEQLRAILETGRDARLAVLIPMVSSLLEVSRVREVLTKTAAALGVATPPLGIMVELESTAANAAAFAPAVDFFSIGTNDLTGDVLGLGRRDQAAGPALAAHPRVLALVKGVAKAGREAGITVSVCGDSAADARVLPLLVGAGVRTVSVPAARVATVRSWISNLNSLACKELTERALAASTAAEVWDLVPAL